MEPRELAGIFALKDWHYYPSAAGTPGAPRIAETIQRLRSHLTDAKVGDYIESGRFRVVKESEDEYGYFLNIGVEYVDP